MCIYFSLSDISFSIIPFKSIHVVANGKISFFFLWLSSISLYVCIFFIHLSVAEHLGYIHILAIVNNVAVNIGVRVIF